MSLRLTEPWGFAPGLCSFEGWEMALISGGLRRRCSDTPLPEPRPCTDSLAAGPDPATVCPAAGVMVSLAGTEDPRVPLFPTPGPGRRLGRYTCRNSELGPRGPGLCFISMPPM